YTIPVVPRLDVSLGLMLGGGNLTFKNNRDYGFGKQWDQAWNQFGSTQPADEYTVKLSGSYFIYQPTLNVEFAVFRWLGIRAGAAYNAMSGGSWKQDDKYDLYGVPSDVNAKGWMLNGGIFAGFFLF